MIVGIPMTEFQCYVRNNTVNAEQKRHALVQNSERPTNCNKSSASLTKLYELQAYLQIFVLLQVVIKQNNIMHNSISRGNLRRKRSKRQVLQHEVSLYEKLHVDHPA